MINLLSYKWTIYYSIKTALKSKLINTVVVSTDSKKYQSMVIKFGASAPFLRPNKYSNDNSSDRDFILHASKFLISKNNYPDLIVLLRPTTPNRDIKIVNKGIKYGMGYEELQEIVMHNPDLYDENGYSKDDRLSGYIRDNLFLSQQQFNYSQMNSQFILPWNN